jgi:hypothetical protein
VESVQIVHAVYDGACLDAVEPLPLLVRGKDVLQQMLKVNGHLDTVTYSVQYH